MTQVRSPLRGRLLSDHALVRFNTWRVGGEAQRLFIPADREDLSQFLAGNGDEPVTWLGLGSNVLIREGGVRGTVIVTHPGLSELSITHSGLVRVEAGVPCAKLAKYAARNGFIGAEFFVGIPGTMGGALAMNAGAFGGVTWALVEAVETITAQGDILYRSAAEFSPTYRHVSGLSAQEWFVAAYLRCAAGDVAAALAQNKQLLQQRVASQPIGLPSCGSVFRNPEGDYAARLIEACGLKGFTVGGSFVSPKHANFIVHQGQGRAHEIEYLMEHVQERVQVEHGIKLTHEVRILGDR